MKNGIMLIMFWIMAAVALVACGGGGGSADNGGATGVQVAVTPATATVETGESRNFSAAVSGTSNMAVTWSVVEANGGSVNGQGQYTAPATVGTFHLKATSTADSTRSAQATITVMASAIPVINSFTASPASIGSGQSSTLAWDVAGATSLSIDQNIGTVTGSSTVVNPTATTTFTLTASNVKGSAQRSTTLTVNQSPPTSVGLHTAGNHIYKADGTIWQGRGANLMDTRSCNACTDQSPNANEVKRRVDELVGVWKASFIRLDLESYASAEGYRDPNNYRSPLDDPAFVADIRSIVQHIGTKPNVYVQVSLWVDPSIDAMGWPTPTTNMVWSKLVDALGDQPHVLFGVINEPQSNSDGSRDAQVLSAMNLAVQAIRDAETRNGFGSHVISVQGTRGWARRLDYYVTHPITAGGGKNIAYETHVYDPTSQFQAVFEDPSKTLPVIIGEFGPTGMTETDCGNLMDSADARQIPYLAWTFHMRCPPNLLVDNSNNSCGVDMPLVPTSWGELLKSQLTGAIKVIVSPDSKAVVKGQTAQFSASVRNTSDQQVRWSVQEPGGGSVNETTGSYTAPAAIGTYHVIATSHADPSKNATATVTVIDHWDPQIRVQSDGGAWWLTASAADADSMKVFWNSTWAEMKNETLLNPAWSDNGHPVFSISQDIPNGGAVKLQAISGSNTVTTEAFAFIYQSSITPPIEGAVSSTWDPGFTVLGDGGSWWMSVSVDNSVASINVQWNGLWYVLARQNYQDANGRPVYAISQDISNGAELVLQATATDGRTAKTKPFKFDYGTITSPPL